MHKKIYFSLDVNDKFITLVAQDLSNQTKSVVGFDKIETKGYYDYKITNQNEFVAQLKKLISNFETKNFFKVNKVGIVINSKNTNISIRTKTVKLERTKAVTSDNVNEALNSLKDLITTDVKTAICALPLSYRLDYEKVISPIGKYGKHLEVKTLLVSSSTKDLYEYLYAIELAGLDIIEICPSYIANIFETFDLNDNRKRVMLFDLGYNHTQIIGFDSGVVTNVLNFEFGIENFKDEVAAKFGIKDNTFDKIFEVIYKNEKHSLEQAILLNNIKGVQVEFLLKDLKSELDEIIVQTFTFIKKELLESVTDFAKVIFTNVISDFENLVELSNMSINREVKVMKNDSNIFSESIYNNSLGLNQYVSYLEDLIDLNIEPIEFNDIKYETSDIEFETTQTNIDTKVQVDELEQIKNDVVDDEYDEYEIITTNKEKKSVGIWQKIKNKIFDNKGEGYDE